MRRLRLLLILLGVVAFLFISGLLARAFSLDGAERSAILSLVQAQARGEARAMERLIEGCAHIPSCQARARANASHLKHPGSVTLIQVNPSAGFSLTSTVGTARTVWRADSELPVVQCVRVRRAGNVISGFHIELLKLSARIKTSADCPARY